MDLNDLITKFNAMVYFVEAKQLGKKDGITFKLLNGYSILIKETLSQDKMTKAIEHELWHIILGHLDEHKDMTEVEKELEVQLNMKNAVSHQSATTEKQQVYKP